MDIATRTQEDITVLSFSGSLDTNTAPEAEELMNSTIEGGALKLVVDFTNLDYIASSGLRVLLATAKKLNPVGGGMRMFGLNESVAEVFEISGFSTIFNVVASEEEALAGF